VKYLLDTDHISILQRQSAPEFATLRTRLAPYPAEDLALSIVSFHEQVMGCHTYISRARTTGDAVRGYGMLARVLRDFAMAPVLPFDSAAASLFDTMTAQKVRVATMDLRIASIALSRNLVLLTRNVRDFARVPGLRIENWAE
jgi:tRNA(fMet)-specific endonuclease VapC